MAEQTIARWVSILYRYGQNYISRALEDLGIGSGQLPILMTLYRQDGLCQENMAAYLKIDKGCVAKSVKKLEEAGFIERAVDLEDRRTNNVFLTQKAYDNKAVVWNSIKSWEEFLLSGMTEEEKAAAAEILRKMAQNALNLKGKE